VVTWLRVFRTELSQAPAARPDDGTPGLFRLAVELIMGGIMAGALSAALVIVAGLFETGFAVLLKQSQGITRLWPTVGFAACALISFGLLTMALKKLEVGSAYAVWTGLGAAGTAVVGMWALGESVSMAKLISIGLILAGVIGLNLAGVTPP
jgi:quaternary ammonium compound-resistance protein SugE